MSMILKTEKIIKEWTDYNRHMNVAYYVYVFDIAADIMINKKNIHPNLDYPSGPTYHLMGFDTDFFTPIFVISRTTGWSAHIMEQHTANKLIRPLSKYSGEKHRKVTLLNQR